LVTDKKLNQRIKKVRWNWQKDKCLLQRQQNSGYCWILQLLLCCRLRRKTFAVRIQFQFTLLLQRCTMKINTPPWWCVEKKKKEKGVC